jgi:hypothetical protein
VSQRQLRDAVRERRAADAQYGRVDLAETSAGLSTYAHIYCRRALSQISKEATDFETGAWSVRGVADDSRLCADRLASFLEFRVSWRAEGVGDINQTIQVCPIELACLFRHGRKVAPARSECALN